MKVAMRTLLLLPALALSGCALSTYCEGEQRYQAAESYPPLQGVEGVKVPESQAALRIPPPPPNAVAYGETYKDEDGDDAVRCLDKPPAMPEPPAPKPEAAKPAAATPPAAAPPTAETPAPAPG
jgi:hypothetical protein